MRTENVRYIKIIYMMLASTILFVVLLLFAEPSWATSGTIVASEEKTSGIPVIYGITCAVSLILVVFCCILKKNDVWMVLLSVSVFICNMGYFYLSISKSLEEALLANRIAYLGSVYLVLFMLLLIMNTCKINPGKIVRILMVCISTAVFIIASSGGYLDIYYKSASLILVNGTAMLVKIYGPLHCVYYIYLLAYFCFMLISIAYSVMKKKTDTYKYASFFATVVFGNIGIWLCEQFMSENFEFLSVSYVITEILVLFMFSIMNDNTDRYNDNDENYTAEMIAGISELDILTAREREVALLLVEDKKRKDIAEELGITEHTVKKHTSNIFSKLEVTSRKELKEKIEK